MPAIDVFWLNHSMAFLPDRCSRSECCSPSFAWTNSLNHRRCRPIFLLDVQKLQRCVPNVDDLMPRDRGSVYVAAGTNLDLPCALLVPHLTPRDRVQQGLSEAG